MAQYLYIWEGTYWFSVTLLSKWPLGGHIGFFGFQTKLGFGFEYQLQTSVTKYLCIWVRAYWFSVTSFSKWLPGVHIRFSVSGWHGFSSVTQVCFGISVSNFMCMSFVAVGRSLTIVSYVACKMAILNNVQLQSTHCPLPPSPMGRGYPSRSLIYNF